MEEDNNNNHHHHDLPPFPSAAGILLSPSPPQNSHLPILPPPPLGLGLGFSSPPPSFFFTNIPSHIEQQQQQLPSSHFPPSFLTSYAFPLGTGNGNNGNEPSTNSAVLPNKDEGRRVFDAWTTKVARSKRRLARQRSLTLTKTSSSSSSGVGCSSDEYSKGLTITHYPNTDSHSNRSHNFFTFCTPDKKILRMLLKKELKNSDVGSLGRIVLPKREAEENLPLLTDKEGMQVVIRDVNSNRKWVMKYKYWANNRSRMYVLENTGDFVRQNGLLMGDVMTLYEDECKNLIGFSHFVGPSKTSYVSVEKGENHSCMEENYEMRNQQSGIAAYTNMDIKDEEEEASLALLIEELKHKAEEDELACNNNNNNNIVNNNNNLEVSQNTDSSYFERGSNGYYMSNNNTRRPYSSSSNMGAAAKGNNNNNNNTNGKEVEDHLQAINGFEDCFRGLDTLPEVSGFKFPLFDYLSNDRT